MHECMRRGQGTRDLCGASGLTTEGFVEAVGLRLDNYMTGVRDGSFDQTVSAPDSATNEDFLGIDMDRIKNRFEKYDRDGNGAIDLEEFTRYGMHDMTFTVYMFALLN